MSNLYLNQLELNQTKLNWINLEKKTTNQLDEDMNPPIIMGFYYNRTLKINLK